jgi:hypothetical protein
MQADEKRIDEAKKEISRLYHDNIDINVVIQLMRAQNISARFVTYTYEQLSADTDEKLTTKRFDYYITEDGMNRRFDVVICWTSRYLIAYSHYSSDSTSHQIKIIDSFNDKSM